MVDDRTNVADEFVAAMAEAVEVARGARSPSRVYHPPVDVDVKRIRCSLGLTQPAFAMRYGFTVSCVRDWEQKRRQPEQAARAYLEVIAREPEAVDRALEASIQAQ